MRRDTRPQRQNGQKPNVTRSIAAKTALRRHIASERSGLRRAQVFAVELSVNLS